MSINQFPVFTVSNHDRKPCGHQHQTQESAENCAATLARSYVGRKMTVLRWERLDSEGETASVSVSHFEAKLKGVGDDN